ncbi:threonine synthase-like 2 isoform X1 [Haliotis rubra]|uniref:threonine synthase-like 2 isoform X1 n=2 Tax=Haliotis rubra TaxID=36100 RepID=UPI001EE54532|nr:threonine synthase-like 2 isoform X1 [Haliotis rubra]XP_046562760.1 threonine synthase-like 2 isoform X1 [Haliotis rubra]XP_046562761.1 threonine synthase-like 2 isoform X1 [Haliotis rubra]
MKFASTRGGARGLTFEEALYSGYAADGGILLPESVPQISTDTLKSWAGLSYVQLVKKIIPYFVGEEIPLEDLSELVDKAFSRFSHPDIIPIKKFPGGLNVMEMCHGATFAFKDLALSCLGQFFDYFLNKRKKHLTVLTATSGDTGSAAIEAVRGMTWVDIIVLLPRGRTSRFQELQMTTVIEDNVHVYRIDGTSDDGDIPIKECFADAAFVKKHNLCSINSINFARIMVQVVHYFYAYLQMRPACDGEVEIAIPTGGCGNVTSGCLARKMGLPVKLVCCVNTNDIVYRTIVKGDYSMREVKQSLAPAMDIQLAYNMERIWHMFSDGDVEMVSNMMAEFEKTMKVKVPENLRTKIGEVISSHVVDDEGIKRSMMKCWEENIYLVCPHSATALDYHYSRQGSEDKPRVCLASASPVKFEETVLAAGLQYEKTDAVVKLHNSPTKYQDWNKEDDWVAMLQQKIEDIEKTVQARNTA